MAWYDFVLPVYSLNNYIYHRWIADAPSPALQPFSLTLPSVDEGTPVPLIYGRCRVRAPVLIWSGNYLVPGQEYTRRIDGSTATADHYSVDMLFLVGLPFYGAIGSFTTIYAGDVQLRLAQGDGLFIAGIGTVRGPADRDGHTNVGTASPILDGVFFGGSPDQGISAGHRPTFSDGVDYGTVTNLANAMYQTGLDPSLLPHGRNQMMVYAHIGLGQSASLRSVRSTSRSSRSRPGPHRIWAGRYPTTRILRR